MGCFTKKASVLPDAFCLEHMFNVWMFFYAQNVFVPLCVVMMMSSIVTLHRWARTTRLSIVGMEVPWSHLYTVLHVVSPHALWMSLTVTPLSFMSFRMFSPVAAISIVGIFLSPSFHVLSAFSLWFYRRVLPVLRTCSAWRDSDPQALRALVSEASLSSGCKHMPLYCSL